MRRAELGDAMVMVICCCRRSSDSSLIDHLRAGMKWGGAGRCVQRVAGVGSVDKLVRRCCSCLSRVGSELIPGKLVSAAVAIVALEELATASENDRAVYLWIV